MKTLNTLVFELNESGQLVELDTDAMNRLLRYKSSNVKCARCNDSETINRWYRGKRRVVPCYCQK